MIFKNNKGFTLIELILVISILAVIVLISSNGILLMYQSHSQTYNEYDLQSSARIISDQVSETIKYSKAIFSVPMEYVDDVSKMDPEWSFVALAPDKKSVISYKYNSGTGQHEESVLLAPQDNIEYELKFEKKSDYSETVIEENDEGDEVEKDIVHNDSVLYYSIVAYNLTKNSEGDWVKGNQKIIMESEVKALNALQVVDKGTPLSPAVAIAYRHDDEIYGDEGSHVVKVGLVLDKSGSMNWNPGEDNNTSGTSRIEYLKQALLGPVKDGKSGMIAKFAIYPNFEISLVPFSTRSQENINDVTNEPFFNAQSNKDDIITKINNMTPSGGTNTGDGIRKAYFNLINFSVPGYDASVQEHDFTIILVDGDSTMFSYTSRVFDKRIYQWIIWPIWGEWIYFYNHVYLLNDIDGYQVADNDDSLNDSAFGYVTEMGNKIINVDNYDGTYYLIGYVTDPDSAGVQNIKDALNIDDDKVFLYNDSDFDLNEVFSNIADDIIAEEWLYKGPQIQGSEGE